MSAGRQHSECPVRQTETGSKQGVKEARRSSSRLAADLGIHGVVGDGTRHVLVGHGQGAEVSLRAGKLEARGHLGGEQRPSTVYERQVTHHRNMPCEGVFTLHRHVAIGVGNGARARQDRVDAGLSCPFRELDLGAARPELVDGVTHGSRRVVAVGDYDGLILQTDTCRQEAGVSWLFSCTAASTSHLPATHLVLPALASSLDTALVDTP